MGNDEADPWINNIVRRYTWKLETEMKGQSSSNEPQQELQAALVESQKYRDDIETLFQKFQPEHQNSDQRRTSDLQNLAKQHAELADAFQRFRKSMPPEYQDELDKGSLTKDAIMILIERAKHGWEMKRDASHFGEIKKRFHRITQKLDSHSNALEMLPSSSEYVSIFYGTILTVIQASVTYSKVSDGLDQALSEINDAVATVDTKAWLYPTPQVKKYVMQLYTQIFRFLQDAMEWYTKNRRHRLRLSFNQNLYSDLATKITKIKETSRLISDEIQGVQSAEIRAIRLQHEKDMEIIRMYLFADAQEKREIKLSIERLEESLKRVAEAKLTNSLQENKSLFLTHLWDRLTGSNWSPEDRILHETLARPAKKILGGTAKSRVQAESSRRLPHEPTSEIDIAAYHTKDVARKSSGHAPEIGHRRILKRKHAQRCSVVLEKYFSADQIFPRDIDKDEFHTKRQTLDALQLWVLDKSSDLLYIQFPSGENENLSGASLAVKLRHMLSESNIPCLSYFLSPIRATEQDDEEASDGAVLAIIYALIWQLTNLLPRDTVDEPPDLTVEDFSMLNGQPESLDTALDLLATLLVRTRQPVMFCIIDGLQWMNVYNSSLIAQVALKSLITLLSSYVEKTIGIGRSFKMLFTSSGLSDFLMDEIDTEKIIYANNSPRGKGSGKRNVGRSPISRLTFL